MLAGLGVQGDAVPVPRPRGGLVSARGLLALGVWCPPGRHVTLCLSCAGHVPVLANNK